MLQFDAATTRLLETAYLGRDITERRRANFFALDPRPGDTVLDLGCGNGLMTADLARAVGPFGQVIGIDPSADMRGAAEARTGNMDNVSIRDGMAGDLPLDTSGVDRAVSVQVFEYIEDVPAALTDLHRVLRPGGRLVLGDMLFGSLVWHSEKPDRMARLCNAWDRHVVHTDLPLLLPALLRNASFEVDSVAPFTFVDHLLRTDGIARMMMVFMTRYAVQNGHVSAEEARDWSDEQEALAREGRFFFSLTHVVVSARRV
ncbi:methyltransferase domain-containing protein [Thetidibacter halocola]|uniref:Methyltransferase domain-containing protein n=1 Tax=Thetidibacter halocola TaxID=2827239 RepID=A0A8J7WIA4_9RHOB|nr:methyltransferase domain-containing protein [Thetidibacter halocola]MBS0125828.1 methyltransferase domain-containing protein [Thetidibacter halocola]